MDREEVIRFVREELAEHDVRICSECGSAMIEGYVIDDGSEYYCSDACLNKHYSMDEYMEMYNNDEAYWTQW